MTAEEGDKDTELAAAEARIAELERAIARARTALPAALAELDRRAERIAELERSEVALRESIEALTTELTTVTRERDDLVLEHVRRRAGPTAEEERAATTRRRGRGRR